MSAHFMFHLVKISYLNEYGSYFLHEMTVVKLFLQSYTSQMLSKLSFKKSSVLHVYWTFFFFFFRQTDLLELQIMYQTDYGLSALVDGYLWWTASSAGSRTTGFDSVRSVCFPRYFGEEPNFKQFAGAISWKFPFKGRCNSFWK